MNKEFKKMIITIDCRMIDSSGIGSYLRGILPFLLQTEHNFFLLGNKERLSSFSFYQNVYIIECNIKPFSLKEIILFPYKILKQINKTDVFFTPFFNFPEKINIPIFITIHDIIFPDMRELTSKAGLFIRMYFFRRAYKKAKMIFTVSLFSKSRIEFHLGNEKPVVVTYNACNSIFYEYRAKLEKTEKKENIVFIGNIKKHKGLDCLLDAFYLAKKEGLPHKLIIIGNRDNFRTADNAITNKINSIGNNEVIFTGFISDEQLMQYLGTASLLVQPSLYEGFCLPPLEAMILGTRTLISDIPVLKEIYDGFPVTFFKTGNHLDLKDKMLELLLNKENQFLLLNDNLSAKYNFKNTSAVIMKNITC